MRLNPFSKSVSKADLLKEWTDKRPLPLGRAEFEAWSDRIIAAAMVEADVQSQKFALSDMILHLGPTEDHKEDAYFIKTLRKVAVNQVADAMRTEIRNTKKAELGIKTCEVCKTEWNAKENLPCPTCAVAVSN